METKHTDTQISRPVVDQAKLEKICHEFLVAIGEDPTREGLVDTPKRFAKMWKAFIERDPGKLGTSFSCKQLDQMVIVSGIRIYSFCEHHIIPFWADIHIGYIADKCLLGASKLARIARKHAQKLNIQEEMVAAIAKEISELAKTENVAVVANGMHLCMVMRGAETEAKFMSSEMMGVFRHKPEARAEFMQLCFHSGTPGF